MDTRIQQQAALEQTIEAKNNLMRQLTLNPNIETQEKNKKIARLICEITKHEREILNFRLAESDEREKEALNLYHQQYSSR